MDKIKISDDFDRAIDIHIVHLTAIGGQTYSSNHLTLEIGLQLRLHHYFKTLVID